MSFPLAATGEFARAIGHLQNGLGKVSEWPGEHDLYAQLVDLAARQADLDALRMYAPLAEASAGKLGHVLYEAIAHRAFGVTHRLEGEFTLAEERLNQALAIFQNLEAGWQTGRTYFELGNLASARDESAIAANYYRHSLALFEEIKAKDYLSLAQDALDSLANGGKPVD